MSDQPDTGPLPELTPEQDSAVRRLLAEARHDEPMPSDVADRLDEVLAGLTRDEPGSPGVAPVIDLAARRRRRNAAALLAGAAAVIVAGFGIGQVIDVGASDNGAGGSSTAANADRAGDSAQSPESFGSSASGTDGASEGASGGASTDGNPAPIAGKPLLRLSSRHLARDLATQLPRAVAAAGSARTPSAKDFVAYGCLPPTPPAKFGLGDFFPALFDGSPAVLALRPPASGEQQADVLSCDTAASLGSVTLRSP